MKALIFNHRAHREADRIVTLFSRERGKEELRVPGARWAKGKLKGHLQPLTWSKIRIATGRYRHVIVGAESMEAATQLSLAQRSALQFLIRTASTLVPFAVPQPMLAPFIERAHTGITGARARYPMSVALFWVTRIMEEMGYSVVPQMCIECGAAAVQGSTVTSMAWSPRSEGFVCLSCSGHDPDAAALSSLVVRVLRFYARAGEEQARRLQLDARLQRELVQMMTIVTRTVEEHAVPRVV